jgi:3-isopropylmalate/(R)-2-methylmalate dehydratase small subunit
MTPFTTLTATAAPLDMANVDTDKIIPARFLKTIKRSGLGTSLFASLRYNDDGSEKPDFILNQDKYRGANILIAGENFGCGSSREHAPWALLDFGITCIIAPSFADIFHGNCFKNGILPIVLPADICAELMADAALGPNARLTIDLATETITRPDGSTIAFTIDPFRKNCLLNGLDDIGLTLEHAAAIDSFEANEATARPWQPAITKV